MCDTFEPHRHYMCGVANEVAGLRIKDKRRLYGIMRRTDGAPLTPDVFLPRFGLRVAEFATFQVLNERRGGDDHNTVDPCLPPPA